MAASPLRFSVGLEIHARLQTRHKIFCCCPNQYGKPPNSGTCPICLGLPGSLPVLNPEVIQPALRAAVALNCNIPRVSEFSRKSYFYPDLPRNFQITQFDRPLALGGYLEVEGLCVNLQRIHLEEDAGRSSGKSGASIAVDLNRAGTPLIEIVTEPDLEDGKQARAWLSRLRQLLRYLHVCDGNMETGSLRIDANVGLKGDLESSGPWVELKNLNSFKAVEQAVNFEIRRLGQKLAFGEILQRETRAWDPSLRETRLLRRKEVAAQYRYFPEPDLPLLVIEPRQLEDLACGLPELPAARESRFCADFGISITDAITLCRSRALADYFESCVRALAGKTKICFSESGPLAVGWVLSQVLAALGGMDEKIPALKLGPEKLAEILSLLVSDKIHRTRARRLIKSFLVNGEVSSLLGPDSFSDDELANLCGQVLAAESQKVELFRSGKSGVINFFVGQVMTRSRGSVEAEKARLILLKLLKGN